MTSEEIFNIFVKKIKSGEYQIVNVCRSNNEDGIQNFDFDISAMTITEQRLANLKQENANIREKMNRLDTFMDTEEYRHLSDKEQQLLNTQYNAMQIYADTLSQRIEKIKERLQ